MEEDLVRKQVMLWLEDAPAGLFSSLARYAETSPTTVGDWARGVNRPRPKWWPKLEAFFGADPGHLRRVDRGEIPVPDLTSPVRVTAAPVPARADSWTRDELVAARLNALKRRLDEVAEESRTRDLEILELLEGVASRLATMGVVVAQSRRRTRQGDGG